MVKVYELVVEEVRFGRMAYSLVEDDTLGRSCQEEGLGMKGV